MPDNLHSVPVRNSNENENMSIKAANWIEVACYISLIILVTILEALLASEEHTTAG